MSVVLRKMEERDIQIMKTWPSYPAEFKDLDYALRDGGWVDDSFHKLGETVYAAEENGELVGFSILSRDAIDLYQAEFSIALRPDRVGRGLGKTISLLTIEIAFFRWGLMHIFLIVRKTNFRAKRLYEYLGFELVGQTQRNIQGKTIDLFEMSLSRVDFEDRWVRCGEFPRNALSLASASRH